MAQKNDRFILLAKSGDLTGIDALLESGADIDQCDEYGFTMILEAAELGHSELFWYLAAQGADLLVATPEGFSLAHAIALGGTPEMLRFAIRNGVDAARPRMPGKRRFRRSAQ